MLWLRLRLNWYRRNSWINVLIKVSETNLGVTGNVFYQ